ncbi:MAG: trypsin-like serine protease [Thiothrix sp.]|nr:trypsin-like serine protease [Thiothrix sp.]HPQ96157.1 trypsin-like serine protease [Thiolinea sp.]
MKSATCRLLLLLPLMWLGTRLPVMAAESLQVSGETYHAQQQVKPASPAMLKSAAVASSRMARGRPMTMDLGSPSAQELAPLNQNNARLRPYPIGISRVIPDLPDVADWAWSELPDGGQAAAFELISRQASRIRVLIQANALPDGVEIRLFDPLDPNHVLGPFRSNNFRPQGSHPAALWTPSFPGESLGLELYAPPTINPADIHLSFPRLSHLIQGPGGNSGLRNTSAALRLSSCEVSAACAPTEWQEEGKAVARYVYTDTSGFSYLCTGTLIADSDTASQIPYFLTAAHCINNTAAADSMEPFWFYQDSSCGSNDASWQQTGAGATLLSTRPELDSTLVLLKNPPPDGVRLSGWRLDPLADNAITHSLQHGNGDKRQYSEGNFVTYTSLVTTSGGYSVTPNPSGDFTRVSWYQGITAPGSSGSGLWLAVGGERFLKGTLVGGSSSCTNPAGPDEYTRLERFYPHIAPWLGQAPALPSFINSQAPATALVDGVLAARYMNGLRGQTLTDGVSGENIDTAALEQKLADALPYLDIDADGASTASRDGLLLIRYLTGYRGTDLLAGIDQGGAFRNTPEQISAYLAQLLQGQEHKKDPP